MRDASDLRAQAELCLELARQINSRQNVEDLTAQAARYRAEAAEIETARPPAPTGPSPVGVEQPQARGKTV